MEYRREIDGLRAVAVMPVILFHAGFETFSGGFIGVDVFFVISGYLITSIILHEGSRGQFSLLDFYERRARRILPALFLVMLVSIPFAWAWMLPHQLKDFGQSVLAAAVFLSNFFFWLETDYFNDFAETAPLLHIWTLAVEEQYYVLFPLLLMSGWFIAKRFGHAPDDPGVRKAMIVFFALVALTPWRSGVPPDIRPQPSTCCTPVAGNYLSVCSSHSGVGHQGQGPWRVRLRASCWGPWASA